MGTRPEALLVLGPWHWTLGWSGQKASWGAAGPRAWALWAAIKQDVQGHTGSSGHGKGAPADLSYDFSRGNPDGVGGSHPPPAGWRKPLITELQAGQAHG